MIANIEQAINCIRQYEHDHGKPLTELEVTEAEYVALKKSAEPYTPFKIDQLGFSIYGVKIKIKEKP